MLSLRFLGNESMLNLINYCFSFEEKYDGNKETYLPVEPNLPSHKHEHSVERREKGSPINYIETIEKETIHKHSPNVIEASPDHLIPYSSSQLIELQDVPTKIVERHSQLSRSPILVENDRPSSAEGRKTRYIESARLGSYEIQNNVERRRTGGSQERRLLQYKKYNEGHHRVPIEAEKGILIFLKATTE